MKNSMHIGETMCVGGDLNLLQEDMKTSGVKFFAGFVQWSPNQLEQEIKQNKWWVGDIEYNELFMLPFEKLWQFKLLDAGHIYGMLCDCPDPVLN
jgi:putative transcriptional regulator